jgi:hypothetical protein
MNSKMNSKLKYCYLIFILTFIIGCQGKFQGRGECTKYRNESYSEETTDTALVREAFECQGNRPEAEKCNKKTYKLVGRGSPRYDKIAALCESILEYEDQLKFRYEQLNKIR